MTAPDRLRLLQVGPVPPPVGGMATVVSNLSAAMSSWADVRILNNRKTTAAERPLWQGIAAQLRLLIRLAAHCLAWRPHVVHIHTCSGATFWRNAVDVEIARLLGRRVLLHIHGAQFHLFLDSLSARRAALARHVFRRSDRVLVLGTGWKRVLDPWCGPDKVVVVPNGVAMERLAEPPANGPFTIVCLANYERRKGQADLLRAVAELRKSGRDLRVALLGFESQAGYRQELIDLAASLGIAAAVTVPGPVVGEEKRAWWARASCFCLPSYDEGLPMAMLEAMAQGLPVVVTRVGAIPEAVSEGTEGLLYDAGDVAALIAHLQSIVDDPARAREIGRNGRERIVREFTLESSVRRLQGLCSELAVA